MGESPVKVLLLHGGPGLTHEYLENFHVYLPKNRIEMYFYDQLGSYFSDQPDDMEPWTIERFTEEIEEVRKGLSLEDFYLFGHSWGGVLAIEYALKYGDSLKGLIISNMAASSASWEKKMNELRDLFPQEIIQKMKKMEAENQNETDEYFQIYWEYFGKNHICRLDALPEAVIRSENHINLKLIDAFLGNEEFKINGKLKEWNSWDKIQHITVPTLLITGRYDYMAAEDHEEMGRRIPDARVCICENGSHLTMWDDTEDYFQHLIQFIEDVENREG